MLFFLFFFLKEGKESMVRRLLLLFIFSIHFQWVGIVERRGRNAVERGGNAKKEECRKTFFFFFLRRVGRGFHLYISFTAATAVAIAVVGAVADVDVGAAEGKVHRELRTKNIFFHSSTFLSPLIEKFLLLKKKKISFFLKNLFLEAGTKRTRHCCQRTRRKGTRRRTRRRRRRRESVRVVGEHRQQTVMRTDVD